MDLFHKARYELTFHGPFVRVIYRKISFYITAKISDSELEFI